MEHYLLGGDNWFPQPTGNVNLGGSLKRVKAVKGSEHLLGEASFLWSSVLLERLWYVPMVITEASSKKRTAPLSLPHHSWGEISSGAWGSVPVLPWLSKETHLSMPWCWCWDLDQASRHWPCLGKEKRHMCVFVCPLGSCNKWRWVNEKEDMMSPRHWWGEGRVQTELGPKRREMWGWRGWK